MASRRSARPFVPAKFRAWRLRRGIGQDEIARRLHYARPSITNIENGKRRPTARFLELLQRVFDVNPETFYVFGALVAVVGVLA